MYCKRLTALLLTIAMLLSMLTMFVGAASSEDEALKEINIFNGGQSLSCLAVNGRVQTLNYVYYSHNGREIPTYCVNPSADGVPQKVGPGESIEYIIGERASDPKIMGIVANGFPTKSLGELGLVDKVEGYYATKIALWCYIIPGWSINAVTVNPNLSGEKLTQAQRVLAAAKKIHQYGTWWTEVPTAALTTSVDRELAYPVTIDGKSYKQQIFTVTSPTFVSGRVANVAFQDPDSVPAGTRIVNTENEDITQVAMEGSGMNISGQFKILYPADAVAGQEGSVQIELQAETYQYGVFYATCAQTDVYGNIQNYLCDTDPTKPITVSAISKYGTSEVPDDPETGLKIIKVQEGTQTPLAGAIFEVKGPDGDVIGQYSTDTSGTIVMPLTISGTYTVTEIVPPENHTLSKNPTQTVTVSYGKVATVTFENAPYGSLHVEKLSDTGDRLEGVTIQIKHIETGTTYTQKTEAGGAAVFTELQPGAYAVQEIAGIEGWLPDTGTVVTVSVATGETVTATLKNKELPGLRILKYDRQTMAVMPNVTFEVFKDNQSIGTYKINQLGEILLPNLEPGTYRVEERHTGDNEHIVEAMPQEIELEAGSGILELVFFNSKKPGLRLVKVDAANPSKVIPNAVFVIQSVDGSFGPQEFTTDENGEIDLSNLDPGAYIVTEKSCPGYVIDEAQRIIQLDPDETGEFVFTNSIKPSLHLIKFSADGTPLGGVTFRISKIEDGSRYLDRTTNAQGEILVSDLEPGVYLVKETATVADHILDETEYRVELFPGKTSTITIQNDRRPNLTIWKHDADTGVPVPGTLFQVKAADGHSITEVKTGADGSAIVENLLPGVYEITEKSVPEPYLNDAEPQLITLHPNRDFSVYFENHKKPNLTINKVDSVTGDPIHGAKFQIWWASSSTDTGDLRDLGIFYTDEKGKIVLEHLDDGWLKIQELEPAKGYAKPEQDTQEVFIRGGESKTVTFKNVPLSALVVYKRDSVTGEAISGARFQLRYLGGETSGTGGTAIGTYTTTSNGSFVVTGLKQGYYICEELESDSGHVIDAAPQSFYISGKDQDIVTLYFSNSPKGTLIIQKVDSTDGTPLEGAEFYVTDSASTVVGENNGKFVTDSKGQICISGIKPGTTLVVTETAAPDGYELDPTPQTIQITAGKTHTLTFENNPVGGVEIIKVDAADKTERLGNAAFEIRKMDDALVDTVTTDKNGRVFLSLEDGSYYTVEIEAPEGYKLDNTPHYFTVKDGKTSKLTITNTAMSGIIIHKIDSTTGKGIYGVSFLLYDEGNNPIGQYTSDDQGYVYIENLETGRYYLRELENEGYILDTQRKTVYVKSGETTLVEWENTPITGQIQIIKKSADDNPINALPAGTLLEGAVFEIYDKAGNVVDTIVSDYNGRAVSRPLPLSRYTIREVKAPDHYTINPTVLNAYLEYEGQILTFEVEDNSVSTGVAIKKTGPLEVMPNQPIQYTITGIGNTSTVPLSSFYWRDKLPGQVSLSRVVTGTYNQQLSYKIVYQTNLSGGTYRTLADSLSTTKNYVLDASPVALGLAANEKVTEIMFVFGTVKGGFGQVETAYILGTVAGGLTNGSSFVNVADVGGVYNGQWIQAVSRWVTKVYAKTIVTLPQTGY